MADGGQCDEWLTVGPEQPAGAAAAGRHVSERQSADAATDGAGDPHHRPCLLQQGQQGETDAAVCSRGSVAAVGTAAASPG